MSNWLDSFVSETKKINRKDPTVVLRLICNEVIVSDKVSKIDLYRGGIKNYLPKYHPLFLENELDSTEVSYIKIKVDGHQYCYNRVDFLGVLNDMYFSSLPFFEQCLWLFMDKSFSFGDRSKNVLFVSKY